MKQGFIIDAPNALVVSGDRQYHCITASSGQIQLAGTTLDIKAGWSLYNLASVPSGVDITVTLTDAQMNTDAFAMATAATETKETTVDQYFFGTPYTVDTAAKTITIPAAVKTGSLKISGMKEVTEAPAAQDEFKVAVADESTTITFSESMVSKQVLPSYVVAVEKGDRLDVLNDSFPKKGSVILQFPVYATEDNDSAVVGIGQITIFSAAIQQNMTFGGSYKTASTFETQIKALDAKRPDKKVFSYEFIPAVN